MKGKLSPDDYFIVANLIVFLFAIFLLGFILALTLEADFNGWDMLFTGGSYLIMSTAYPIIKYFNTLKWSWDMIVCAILAVIMDIWRFNILACYLEGDTNSDASLVCACIVTFYPIVVLTGAAIYKWYDDRWHDGKFIKVMLPISFFFISIFNFIVYAWVGVYPGIVFTLVFLTCSVALFLLRVWSKNDNYLPFLSKEY